MCKLKRPRIRALSETTRVQFTQNEPNPKPRWVDYSELSRKTVKCLMKKTGLAKKDDEGGVKMPAPSELNGVDAKLMNGKALPSW